MITPLGLKAKSSPKKCKKARYYSGSISNKDLSNNIREFEKLPYKHYQRRRPKHERTDRYFYLARELAKCMMISDALNSDNCPVRTDTTGAKHIRMLYVFSTGDKK